MSLEARRVDRDAEATAAAWESARGAVIGAMKWGVGAALLSVVGYRMSPVYRGLTIQFKVYIQMSAMVMGGMIEAENRLRMFEAQMRAMRREEAERQRFKRLMAEYGEDEE